MPMKLYVYSHKGYGEFTLPGEEELTYSMLISKKKFMSSADIEILLCQENGNWHFSQCSKYIVYQQKKWYNLLWQKNRRNSYGKDFIL